MDVYESTIEQQEEGEIFYIPCTVIDNHLWDIKENGHASSLGMPISWLGKNLKVLKKRPRELYKYVNEHKAKESP